MNLQTIKEKLDSAFAVSERVIIFWYDDNCEFEQEIGSLELAGAKIHILTGDNIIYTKYLLEYSDKESSYLVYAPFSKPIDRDNPLADMVYYSKQFFADRISIIAAELGIPDEFKPQLANYSKFWKSQERIDKFTELKIEKYDSQTIDIGVLAVLCSVKTPSFDEVLKTLILSGNFDDNKYLIMFEKSNALSVFWQLCERLYGYSEDFPNLEKLVMMLMVTYTAHDFKGDLPRAWQGFVSFKKNDIFIFVSNLMNNNLHKEKFDQLANDISTKIRTKELISGISAKDYLECDVFEDFDKSIIDYMACAMINTGQRLDPEHNEIINRRGLVKHYSEKFADYYYVLDRASKLLAMVQEFSLENFGNISEMVENYVSKWCGIDRYYRGFYTAFDKLSPGDTMLKLREMIENCYTNSYLSKLSKVWAERLENIKSINEIGNNMQYDFYRKEVEPYASKECTVVIISDAFRYECALDLEKQLSKKSNVNCNLGYMISSVPSYTKLGMASLLPHKNIAYTDDFGIMIDSLPCGSSVQRADILKTYVADSFVCLFTEIMAMDRETLRKNLSGKSLIYIYHNQIDARGDNSSTENEVFTAAGEAVSEIAQVIQKITVNRSITNYIVTSDHGFIYKRDKLDESSKVSFLKSADAFMNKRFILSKDGYKIDGAITYSLGYLGDANKAFKVTVPRGAEVFKIAGGGQNFVHGGASLQEIVIPLLKVKTGRGKIETSRVDVELYTSTRKITNLITYIDFLQKENVTEGILQSEVIVYFENQNGDKISGDVIIIANKKNETPEKRTFREKFTLRNRKYSRNESYYLVMKNDDGMEINRHEFTIDIAFADDFGFDI